MLGSYLVLIDREDDKRAFEFLYEENCGKMFTIAYNICKSEVLAEDAVADAFLGVAKTFSKFSSLDEEDKIPYLIRAVKNSALNVVRREKTPNIILLLKVLCLRKNLRLTFLSRRI